MQLLPNLSTRGHIPLKAEIRPEFGSDARICYLCHMNSLATHIEYLLKRHECVALPGVGSFLCNYKAARFAESDSSTLLPPSRLLIFNELLCENDGILAKSISRRMHCTYEQGAAEMSQQIALFVQQLREDRQLPFGRLGVFTLNDNNAIEFKSYASPSLNGSLYGLRPITMRSIEEIDAENPHIAPYRSDSNTRSATAIAPAPRRWRAYAIGAVASLAILFTVGLTLINPVVIDKVADMASIIPIHQPTAMPKESISVEPAVSTDNVPETIDVAESIATETPQAATDKTMQPESIEADAIVTEKRFNTDDNYYVIVASFPTANKAAQFIQQADDTLGVMEKDGHFRVFAATGPTYSEAEIQRGLIARQDAWICRK